MSLYSGTSLYRLMGQAVINREVAACIMSLKTSCKSGDCLTE